MTALMLARLTGAALLTLAGAGLGWSCLECKKQHLALLRALDTGLGLMAEELCALHTPLPQLFSSLGDRPFFDLLSAGFGSGPVEALWCRAAEAMPLSSEEQLILKSVAPVIGRYDAQRQAAALSLACRRLRARADEAASELKGRARSFPGLGAALGAMAAALLF